MKKLMLGLVMSSVFCAGAAQAEYQPDMSAVLNISGTVKSAASACTVVPSETAVSLPARDVKALPPQDAALPTTTTVTFRVTGDQGCTDKIKANQIGVKFVGTADDANGISLANDEAGDNAAKGVGIGLYNYQNGNAPFKINTDYMVVNEMTNSFGMSLVQLNGETPEAGSVHGSLTLEVVRL